MSMQSEIESLLVQSVMCELDMIEKGDLSCADDMLRFRHAALARYYIVNCLRGDYATYRSIINYLFEEVKEITFLIINKKH